MLEQHLKECGFEKYLKKLEKELEGKSVIVYGTGMLFELICEKYDLSKINIIGVSDMKYFSMQEGELDLGYKIIPLDKITDYPCDVVLIGAKVYYDIIDDFKEEIFYKKDTKILPLVKVPFLKRVKNLFFE